MTVELDPIRSSPMRYSDAGHIPASPECTSCGMSMDVLNRLNKRHHQHLRCCDRMNMQPPSPPYVERIDGAAIDFWHRRFEKFMCAEVA